MKIANSKKQLSVIIGKQKQPKEIFEPLLRLVDTIWVDRALVGKTQEFRLQFKTLPMQQSALTAQQLQVYARNIIEMLACVLKNGYLCKQPEQPEKEQKQQQP